MGMRHVSAKFVPQLLTDEQEHHLFVLSDFLECAEAEENIFKHNVTLPPN
jgi:hypothetical protein